MASLLDFVRFPLLALWALVPGRTKPDQSIARRRTVLGFLVRSV